MSHAASVKLAPPAIANGRIGFWLFLGTEAMLFAGLLSAYIIARISAGSAWPSPSFQLPHEAGTLMNPVFGGINTVLLLSANALVSFGAVRLARGNAGLAWKSFAVALLLGSLFVGVKLNEYQMKVEHRLLPATANEVMPLGQVWSSYYFGLTGLHAAHVVVGLLFLCWLIVLGVSGHLGERQVVLAQNVGSYWYLVDAVWLILFPLLYLI